MRGPKKADVIGQGACRRVEAFGEGWVAKYPRDRKKGAQNEREWLIWQKFKGTPEGLWLCPCVAYEDGVLYQVRAEKLTLHGDFIIPSWMEDIKRANWGIIENTIVLLDYGNEKVPPEKWDYKKRHIR